MALGNDYVDILKYPVLSVFHRGWGFMLLSTKTGQVHLRVDKGGKYDTVSYLA